MLALQRTVILEQHDIIVNEISVKLANNVESTSNDIELTQVLHGPGEQGLKRLKAVAFSVQTFL